MSNMLRKLAVWKRHEQDKAVKQAAVRQEVLRDFIYLDVALVSTYLEQLTGGVPQEARVSRESRSGGEAGLNMSLFHINMQGGGSQGYQENQTIYWGVDRQR